MSEVRSLAEQWKQAPWTVRALLVVMAVNLIAGQFTTGFDVWVMVRSLLFAIVLLYWLFKRSRFAWGVLLLFAAFSAIGLTVGAIGAAKLDNPVWTLAVHGPLLLIHFFLLLHPLTRAWVGPRREPSAERLRKLAHPGEQSELRPLE